MVLTETDQDPEEIIIGSRIRIGTTADSMVPILDGTEEITGHVRSNLCYLICLRHQIHRYLHRLTYWICTHFEHYYPKDNITPLIYTSCGRTGL